MRVCLAYRQYASKRIAKDPEFAQAVKALYGKKVMCFCSNGTRNKKRRCALRLWVCASSRCQIFG